MLRKNKAVYVDGIAYARPIKTPKSIGHWLRGPCSYIVGFSTDSNSTIDLASALLTHGQAVSKGRLIEYKL
jgi:hypothetical protein